MAYEDNQNELPLPGEEEGKRKSERHLPKYFRTDSNTKFLSSTVDQLLQPGVAEKLNGYIGRKTAKAYNKDDNYIGDVSADRENYQLEPAQFVSDNLGNIEYFKDYNDFINQIDNFDGTNTNHDKINREEFYAWDPHIDWDKFTNFREYYWLPTGPQTLNISGEQKEVTSTYTVTLQDNGDNLSYIFSPDGSTPNPSLKLYRGVRYRFEIDTPGLPLTFRTARSLDAQFLLRDEIDIQEVENGVIELELNAGTPNEIFYVSNTDINVGGLIRVANIEEASFIDVEAEIIGKKSYTTREGWSLSNGMKVRFDGEVIPSKYGNAEWYVEGVGDKITLVSDIDVEISFPVGIDLFVPFDAEEGFDRLPFGTAIGYPRDKDYIVINRASADGNFWSRYNRWFHKDVIETSARINNQPANLDQDQRANRPIIEFEAGLKLFNFGTKTKPVVDLIDTFTQDAFSTIEGSLGYTIDGVALSQGMRILFLADKDPLVNGKIFTVEFLPFKGSGVDGQITLQEADDALPQENENVLCVQGETNSGKIFFYDGSDWKLAQNKTSVSQPPLFDIFDVNGNSFSDNTIYESTDFRGTEIFSYKVGNGTVDPVLGFPLSYRSIENVGDILFDFDYNSDMVNYQIETVPQQVEVAAGFLRKYTNKDNFINLGAWTKANKLSQQPVILQYVNDNTRTVYPINCFDRSQFIDDLELRVFVNNSILKQGVDYEILNTADKFKAVSFNNLNLGDVIKFKCFTSATKNKNGFYEIAPNLEKNPLNENVTDFTLGEVTDHVSSIVENLPNFSGQFPGSTNLRDISGQSKYGKKFIKHTAPLNLAMYHLLDREANLVNALRYARREYSKFKRQFLKTAETLGFEGPVKQHVDKILTEINKDKINSNPFYFSDMIPYGASINNRVVIEDPDNNFFALTQTFEYDKINTKAVAVYLNGNQLIYKRDYEFNDEGFLIVTAPKTFDDVLDIYEYETTNGSYVPPTPTKLGLYPRFLPRKYVDNSYITPTEVIEGHDGSIVTTFGDYRDDLIIELEKRIYNNIKIDYNTEEFDINDFVSGSFRNNGYSRSEIDKPMISDFVQWLQLVNKDYVTHEYFDRDDSFTFNYSNLRGPGNQNLPGWWRGVYKFVYDTDRPHLAPWEMLGYSIKPTWWEQQYGPAPYTSNNLLLWDDLEQGIIREPGQSIKFSKKYSRPGLKTFLPVDDSGNLLSPSDSNILQRFDSSSIKENFEFGDYSPVETAWRKSSEYPFALLVSYAINAPSRLLASGFDRSRQVRNKIGQIIYSETGHHIRLQDIVFPNTYDDKKEIVTSGVVNYISGYMASNVTANFKSYNARLRSIKNCLATKLAGFTDKAKFKLILDSRTPLNKGNVFVPEENYRIFLNTSSPIKTVSYSGVIIEKTAPGYIVRGYTRDNPRFSYYSIVRANSDPVINVGGVSEQFTKWDSNKLYREGINVEYNNDYYKVITTHTSSAIFDTEKFAKLPSLPLSGGRTATFARKFRKDETLILPYGTLLRSTQEVVDFLLGYQAYLEDQGFSFDYYDGEEKLISNWETSAREFLFWTTQNWSEGAVISLSPAADQINFTSEYSVVDNVYDNFYGYSILKADGKKLIEEFSRSNRTDPNNFKLVPKNTEEGVYAIEIPVVQKEHVLMIDNFTVFGDVIYDQATGYRQERIRVLGYKTENWDGSLNIPGFVYDQATVREWQPWQDYALGDLVKYKEFYYSAKNKIPGKENFVNSEWVKLANRPEAGLLPNFDYKVNQFADFYDLDSDNFDVEQQKHAQHLIGYQKRQYLENIINDDVSQYKFYQGMIQDKGTLNSLTKLFDVLSGANKESLEFHEEWAIKEGQYGANDGFEEVEFRLDESKFKISPQPFELVDPTNNSTADLIYRIKPFEVFKKPREYDHKPFPVFDNPYSFTKTAGFVNQEDVQFIVSKYDDILSININDFNNRQYVWVGTEKQSWNIYQHVITDYTITSIEGNADEVALGDPDLNQFVVSISTSFDDDIKPGDIIGIYDIIETSNVVVDNIPVDRQITAPIEGFFKVIDVKTDNLVIDTSLTIQDVLSCKGILTKLRSVKTETLEDANLISEDSIATNDKIWVESDGVSWRLIENKQAFNLLQKIPSEATENLQDSLWGQSIDVDSRNTVIGIGAPNEGLRGKVYVYVRGSNGQNFQFAQVIEASGGLAANGEDFGDSIAISPDSKFMLVGSPNATDVKTKFRGDFDETVDYQNGEIVRYSDQLWEAVVDIRGADASLAFSSFGSVIEVYRSKNILNNEYQFNNIVTGLYPFENISTNHILVRAPADQYDATGPGDTVFLDWYLNSTANQDQVTLTPRQPFNGAITGINETVLESGLVVQKKIDAVLKIDSINEIPEVGDQVDATGVFGYVANIYVDEGVASIYIEGSFGIWQTGGSVFKETGEYIGEFQRVAPIEDLDVSDQLGGYWWFNLPTTINVGTVNQDTGKQLAVYNVIPNGKADPEARGGNVYDQNNSLTFTSYNDYKLLPLQGQTLSNGLNDFNSFIATLTAQGFPGPYGNQDVIPSNLFAVRAPKSLTDKLVVGDTVNLEVVQLPNLFTGQSFDISPIGINTLQTNKAHTLVDLWDGFIDFKLEQNDGAGRRFEPLVDQLVRDQTSGATARIAYYQRNGDDARIWVKQVADGPDGPWSLGQQFGQGETLEMIKVEGNTTETYSVDRPLGEIYRTSLGNANLDIGKLCVFELANAIPDVQDQEFVLGSEYIIYRDDTIFGIATEPNIPSQENFDYRPVYRVPVNAEGFVVDADKLGMFTVYERQASSNYNVVGSFIVPETVENLGLGTNIKVRKDKELYKAFIGCSSNANGIPGRIYFINYGTNDDGVFYNWELAKNKNYRGEFSPDREYFIDDIVFLDGNFYKAQTNIAPGLQFNILDWQREAFDGIGYTGLDYVGFIPNNTDFVPDNDSTYKIDQNGLQEFGTVFDADETGNVLVVTAKYDNSRPNRVYVYRAKNGNYLNTQIIEADNSDTKFGESISISRDGMLIAIGSPGADGEFVDEGAVYVYKQTNGTFVQSQKLTSSRNTRKEEFGSSVDFDGNTLFVSAKKSYSDEDTIIDSGTTIFDNDLTKFVNKIDGNGAVYVYDRIEQSLIFGQILDINEAEAVSFGKNVVAKQNHVYSSMVDYTNTDNKTGVVFDFRRQDDQRVWSTFRTPKKVPNLEKIKKVFLYDNEKNEIVKSLDYVDPIQGKIAGPADQNLRYKTSYDPASYNLGNDIVNVDKTNTWGETQVGQLWWDLSTVKFLDPYQGNLIYSTNNWNKLFKETSVDVYEWVETNLKPSEWDAVSRTEEGVSLGISGTSKYGDEVYVTKRVYDSIGQKFNTRNYFWVKSKLTVPNVEWRTLSANAVEKYIADPSSVGYEFVSFVDDKSFVLYNCGKFVKGNDIVLNVQYWTSSDQYDNIHNQYKLVTEGLPTSKPSVDIERKWFDSLVGYDDKSRPVPDINLSPRERYGVLNKPRQSWFINRVEALKQFIERTNSILEKNLIVESKDITKLFLSDVQPSQQTRLYDTVVDTEIDLEFVGVARASRAELTPVIENGRIVRVDITNSGRGYKVVPTYEILGTGYGAEIELTINNLGQVTSATVIDGGKNYKDTTRIIVRRFSVLVSNDSTIRGKWAIYERVSESRSWNRIISQSYDVSSYWQYIDWYDVGYSEFTAIDHVIEESYFLQSLEDNVGDVVKILNIGGSGWLLLEKIDEQETVDYTVNYKTIGQQNGTIQFLPSIYNFSSNQVGFDAQSYDTKFFDSQPIEEVRIILNTLKDEILTDNLEVEYNNLFFASLRYVFAEQGYVDWAFKTSFIKAQHNVGELKQRITFQNDNLESYEEYLKEVKPYKTKLREYVSNYDQIESSSSVVTDFDLPPVYNANQKQITASSIKVLDGELIGTAEDVNIYPNKFWLDNAAYQVVEIGISDPGSGYLTAPVIEFESNSGTGAKAVASLGPNGTLSKIKIIDPGSGYLTAPIITLNGSVRDGGREAVVSAKIGNSLIRNTHSIIKFDRITGSFVITELNQSERFVGTGSKTEFNLVFPMDMRNNTIEVTINGVVVLGSQYTYENYLDTTAGFDRYFGRINFVLPPANNTEVIINYKKSIDLLSASDRINLFYNPTTGQTGKDITQLMDGVDYGGVQVKSYGFVGPEGWDSDNWYDNAWDLFDENFDEESFITDGSTLTFQLSKPLASGVDYNVYVNGIRIDDNAYDGTTSAPTLTNPRAIMAPIVGDGVTDTVTIENEIGFRNFLEKYSNGADNLPGEVVTIRRSTTDGSRELNQESFDTELKGGDLAYSTAKGLNADEITVDGDGFVTPTTSKGPEETVPGQVMDTLDIQVYERPASGSSLMYSSNHRGDGVTKEFSIQGIPYTFTSMFVKIDYEIKNDASDFRIDWDNKKIVFYTAPAKGSNIHLLAMGMAGENVLDYDEYTADGISSELLTNVRWETNRRGFVTVNGEVKPFELFESDASYAVEGNVVIKFVQPPLAGTKIQYALFDSNVQTFSQVTVDEFEADGSSLAYEISQAPFNQAPAPFYTVVTVNDRLLNPGYSQRFYVTSEREYQLKKWQVPVGSLTGDRIEVYLNGRKLSFLQEWTFEGAGSFNPDINDDAQPGSTVILNRGIGVEGDELRVLLISDGEYRFGYFEIGEDSTDTFIDTPTTIHFDEVYSEGDKIRVYQFSNHNSQGIERINYDVISRTEMTVGSEGYTEYRMLKNGLLKLRDEAVDIAYVWIAKNGVWLNPTADYILTENKQYIKFTEAPNIDDVIDVVHFSNTPISSKFGWRVFKDMLNRYYFTRLGSDGELDLAEPLKYYDKTITVTDGSTLPAPLADAKTPGVVFIDSERIEYFKRDGNVLKQLRRGTLGTGVKAIYDAGTRVYNQSLDSTIPYKEDVLEIVALSGNYIDMTEQYTNSPLITFRDIKYSFNNNTVFPLGGQTATVRGTGFRPVVKVFVQDIECSTTYISSTELQFTTPALPVGAYDLVIYNPQETDPVLIPQSSLVVSKQMEYVQILLPFSPLPNPATETGWYKEKTDISVTEIIPGRYYTVKELGNTDWASIGGAAVVGRDFLATDYGTGTGVVEDYSSIAFEYWEAMDIDMFISGRRLRKNPLTYFDPTKAQSSPEGDVTLEAEYAVNKNIGPYVRLTTPPPPKVKIIISKKTGQIWNDIENVSNGPFKYNYDTNKTYSVGDVVMYRGSFYEAIQDTLTGQFNTDYWKSVSTLVPLGKSQTEIASFLREKSITLPR